jgi:hypothetical protein
MAVTMQYGFGLDGDDNGMWKEVRQQGRNAGEDDDDLRSQADLPKVPHNGPSA